MPFQTLVNTQPAPAVEGDFADANPRFTVIAGAGGLVTGPLGVTVGRFAWATPSPADPDGSSSVVNSFGSGPVTGFVHREQQALITAFLADSTLVIPEGFPITLMSGGDFWVKNNGSTQALPGQYAYASLANGAASFGAAGAIATASVTGSIAAGSATVAGYVFGNILTVTGTTGGATIPVGALVYGTIGGSGVTAGTFIVSQLTGATSGGPGTYALSIPEQQVASVNGTGNFSVTWGILTVSVVSSGTVTVGGSIGGTGVSANTVVTALGTGTGNTGTYYVNNTQAMGSSSLTIGQNVQTKWIAMSAGNPGELVKISDHPLG